jgi:hypothetical protein
MTLPTNGRETSEPSFSAVAKIPKWRGMESAPLVEAGMALGWAISGTGSGLWPN